MILAGLIVLVFIMTLYFPLIYFPAQDKARDSACKRIGFEESYGDKCMSEEGFIRVIFYCDGFFRPTCLARRELK